MPVRQTYPPGASVRRQARCGADAIAHTLSYTMPHIEARPLRSALPMAAPGCRWYLRFLQRRVSGRASPLEGSIYPLEHPGGQTLGSPLCGAARAVQPAQALLASGQEQSEANRGPDAMNAARRHEATAFGGPSRQSNATCLATCQNS